MAVCIEAYEAFYLLYFPAFYDLLDCAQRLCFGSIRECYKAADEKC